MLKYNLGAKLQKWLILKPICQKLYLLLEQIADILYLYKGTACGCQSSAAAAFRNTLGMFDYKQSTT